MDGGSKPASKQGARRCGGSVVDGTGATAAAAARYGAVRCGRRDAPPPMHPLAPLGHKVTPARPDSLAPGRRPRGGGEGDAETTLDARS